MLLRYRCRRALGLLQALAGAVQRPACMCASVQFAAQYPEHKGCLSVSSISPNAPAPSRPHLPRMQGPTCSAEAPCCQPQAYSVEPMQWCSAQLGRCIPHPCWNRQPDPPCTPYEQCQGDANDQPVCVPCEPPAVPYCCCLLLAVSLGCCCCCTAAAAALSLLLVL